VKLEVDREAAPLDQPDLEPVPSQKLSEALFLGAFLFGSIPRGLKEGKRGMRSPNLMRRSM
jgi:hypothetical protein